MPNRKYPYYGKSKYSGITVHFIGESTGRVVKIPATNITRFIGYQSETWDEESFTPTKYQFTTSDETIKELLNANCSPKIP